jgi:hypothetical protein
MPKYKVKSGIHRFGYKGHYLSGEELELPKELADKIPHILEPVITVPVAQPVPSKAPPEINQPQTPVQTKTTELKEKKVKG